MPRNLKMMRKEGKWKKTIKRKLCRINMDTLKITIGFYALLFLGVNVLLGLKQYESSINENFSPKLFHHSNHDHNPMINHHIGSTLFHQLSTKKVKLKTTIKPFIAENGYFSKSSLKVINGKFELNKKPFRIISGQIDFTRTIEAEWSDRLTKLKLAGLNTVFTPIIWNDLEIDEVSKSYFT